MEDISFKAAALSRPEEVESRRQATHTSRKDEAEQANEQAQSSAAPEWQPASEQEKEQMHNTTSVGVSRSRDHSIDIEFKEPYTPDQEHSAYADSFFRRTAKRRDIPTEKVAKSIGVLVNRFHATHAA